MTIETIRQIEYLSANAWPAALVEDVDGWHAGFSHGVTRRANSVWPNENHGRLSLAEKLERVEDIYSGWGLPVRYRLTPACQPSDLDDVLQRQGYAHDGLTCVQVASLHSVLDRKASPMTEPVTIGDSLDRRWFAAYCEAEQTTAHNAKGREEILRRIDRQTAYGLLEIGGRPAAVGLGVLEQGWVGVFSMSTLPEFRRRGAATAVLRALATWGHRKNASHMYLQVFEQNEAARALYERLGFSTLYYYHYREAVPAASEE